MGHYRSRLRPSAVGQADTLTRAKGLYAHVGESSLKGNSARRPDGKPLRGYVSFLCKQCDWNNTG